jgi:hypothetical protein
METFLESHDVGRILKLTSGGVHLVVKRGELQPRAVTPRCVRLFAETDVRALQAQRSARAQERRGR